MRAIAAACVVLGFGPLAIGGTMIYGQRLGVTGSTYTVGGDSNKHRMADDFILASAATLISAEFWALDATGNHSFIGKTFELSIWADEGPGLGVNDGGLLASESFAVGLVGLTPEATFTKIAIDFTTPIALSPAIKYWFSIGINDETNFAWVKQGNGSPDAAGTDPVDFDKFADGTWNGTFNGGSAGGLAFSLTGDAPIPLPAGAAMAATALIPLAAGRRRPLAP